MKIGCSNTYKIKPLKCKFPNLFPSPPLILINLQTAQEKLSTLLGYPDPTGKQDAVSEYVLHSLVVVLAAAGDVPEQQLVVDYGHRPDVALGSVVLLEHDLRAHVPRSTSHQVKNLTLRA